MTSLFWRDDKHAPGIDELSANRDLPLALIWFSQSERLLPLLERFGLVIRVDHSTSKAFLGNRYGFFISDGTFRNHCWLKVCPWKLL